MIRKSGDGDLGDQRRMEARERWREGGGEAENSSRWRKRSETKQVVK